MKKLTINEAVQLLRQGDVVGIPTETVYGLAADARSDVAVRKIFEAKGRPADNPLIVHIGTVDQIDELVTDVSANARLLMAHFWPGALTLILPSKGTVSASVTAGLPTIGIRMPNHPVALALLRDVQLPLAAPSANLSGKPSPTSAAHVIDDLANRIPGVVDGGYCNIGLESTVIDMTSDVPVILRPGGISKAQIEAIIGSVSMADDTANRPKAPGMKYTHYAPDARVYLIQGDPTYFETRIADFQKKNLKIGVLCEAASASKYPLANVVKTIGFEGQELYAALRAFDAEGMDIVLCEFFQHEAVMNRLMKASKETIL
ncbi:MAG: L-threonylcarbamoyladenylate synthase [Defluviitaleaceae bacterium]|nr:L-threonylcarbamoyladenylate synthase [Defluviitaleaceae bacterium]